MRDYNKSLTQLKDSFYQLINEYQSLEKNSPFSNEVSSFIVSSFEQFYNSLTFRIDDLNKSVDSYDVKFNMLLKDFYKKEKDLTVKLRNENKEAINNFEVNIDNIDNHIKDLKLDFKRDEADTYANIDYYIDSSQQNIEMFELENQNERYKLGYQSAIARGQYNQDVIKYNDILEKKLKVVVDEYNQSSIYSDKELDKLIRNYNVIIEENKKIIEEKNSDYQKAMVDLKELKRQSTLSLNETVRELARQKDELTSSIYQEYHDKHNEDYKLHHEKSSELQKERQKATRDFVVKIKEIDDYLDNRKKTFEYEELNANQEMNYTIYDLHLNQESELKDIYQENLNPKISKHRIKLLNKDYFKKVKAENDKCIKLLKSLESEYKKNTLEKNYNKKILDITRKYSFKRIDDEQIKTNKFFQEKDNGYENDLNYKKNEARYDFTQKANEARLISNTKNLDIESKMDDLDARYQIQIETINNIIKQYNLEISIATRLNQLNKMHLKHKFDREVNYLTVTNLLLIERCKTLADFNKRQYELNLENANGILNYSKNKISLQNEKYEVTEKASLRIRSKKMIYDLNLCDFDKEKLYLDEQTRLLINEANNIFEESHLRYETSNEKYKIQIKLFQSILDTYLFQYRKMTILWNNLVNYIYKNSYNDNNSKLIDKFFDTAKNYFKSYFDSITDDIYLSIKSIIDSHISFDNDFKYKNISDDNKKNYESELAYAIEEKKKILRDIESVKNKIEDIKRQLYSLRYGFDNLNISKAERNKLIKDLIKKEKDFEATIEKQKNDLKESEKKVSSIETGYSKYVLSIEKQMKKDNEPYTSFSSKISTLFEAIKANSYNTDTTEFENIEKIKFLIPNIKNESIKELYDAFSNFSIDYLENRNVAFDNINKTHDENLLTIDKTLQSKLKVLNTRYEKENSSRLQEIKALEIELKETKDTYDDLIKERGEDHQEFINDILNRKFESANQFYSELYALNDNLDDIIKDYHEFVKEADLEYENNKTQIIDETLKTKKDYNSSLNQYIKTRADTIKHLPANQKTMENQLILDSQKNAEDLALERANAKKEYNRKKHGIYRQLLDIEIAYKAQKKTNDYNERKELLKERHNYRAAK